TATTGNVLASVTDPDNTDGVVGNEDSLIAVLDAGPTNGSLTLNADGSFTYTPDANYFGADSFTYHAVDSRGAASNVATVSLTITEVNEAPVASYVAVATNEDTAATGNVLPSVTDPDHTDGVPGNEDTLAAVLSVHATLPILTLNADGSFNYTPDANYFGADSFTYHAVDSRGAASNVATVSLTINEVNDAPTEADDAATNNADNAVSRHVLTNDSDPDNTDGILGNEDTL